MAFEIVHPAVVHFPVALLMTAAPVAILGAITRKPTWQRVATVCLVLGAAGSFMAVETGEDMDEEETPAGKKLIHEHEEMAEKTMYSAIALALLAVGVEVVTARSMGPKSLGTAGRWTVAAGSVAVAVMCRRFWRWPRCWSLVAGSAARQTRRCHVGLHVDKRQLDPAKRGTGGPTAGEPEVGIRHVVPHGNGKPMEREERVNAGHGQLPDQSVDQAGRSGR